MPLQNRVTPAGEIITAQARGLMMGNRGGRFHQTDQSLTRRRWSSKAWICCRLEFNNRHRQIMAPDSYTELFFLDEATALAAGHRPCFECRRKDAQQFATLFGQHLGFDRRATASEMDAVLHQQRLASQPKRALEQAEVGTLPIGVFALIEGAPAVHLGGRTYTHWTPGGYTHRHRMNGTVTVLTPAAIIAVIASGYQPRLHPSAA